MKKAIKEKTRTSCWVKNCRRETVYQMPDGRESCEFHYKETPPCSSAAKVKQSTLNGFRIMSLEEFVDRELSESKTDTEDSMFDEIIETKIAPDGTVKEKRFMAGETQDTDVHYENRKAIYLTLCGKPTPPAKTSPYKKNVTCETCKGRSNYDALEKRPNYPNPGRRRGE